MAELPSIPLAPADASNQTVILWVVLVLVTLMLIVGPIVVRYFIAMHKANEKRCREDREAAKEERRELVAKLETVMGEQRVELVKTVGANNHVLDKVADNLEGLTNATHKLCRSFDESGPHPARRN